MKKIRNYDWIDRASWIENKPEYKRKMKEADEKLDKSVKDLDNFLNNLERRSLKNEKELEEIKLELKKLSKRITKLEMINQKNRK